MTASTCSRRFSLLLPLIALLGVALPWPADAQGFQWARKVSSNFNEEALMNRLSIVWILAFVFTGCFSGRDVQILEGESDKAYVSLGHIEVKIPAQLSVWRQGPRYKKILRRELLQRAKPLEADALIHIRYWPDLQDRSLIRVPPPEQVSPVDANRGNWSRTEWSAKRLAIARREGELAVFRMP